MRGVLRTLRPTPGAADASDDRMIAACKRGDASAFDDLVRRHEDALRRFVCKRVASEHVEDVVQETWIATWKSLDRFTVRAKFRTYVYAIAANKCRDVHRRGATDELRDHDPACEEAEFGRLELRQAVGAALDQLPPAHRELLDLYYFEEMNLPEIAEITGANLNTVKYRFYRAHKEMAAILERGDD